MAHAEVPAVGRGRGYAMAISAYLIFGAIGALVDWTTAPESLLLVLRFGMAAAVLAIFFARRPLLAELRRPGVVRLLLLMGALDAVSQLCFFVSLRAAGVAVGMFLFYSSPLVIALLAPRLGGERTEPIVWPALGLGLAGLAAIVAPSLLGGGAHWSPLGLACGLAAAVLFALYMLLVKALTRRLAATTIVLADCTLNAVLLLPLALFQTIHSGYAVTGRDLLSAALLGVVCTAFAYWLWVAGVERIPVQHASILGYLEPATAPLYALLLLGQVPALGTVAGGALIIAAGLLLVFFGGRAQALAETTAGAPLL
jgi:drug/metabolite transporter (DMT)-like permease